ncbi:metal ABC transporter ATP-binding protein [Nakamurella silvestris]|nr:metal ABC transporter ATP-binding protein [Nakamurella silvestris]
MPSTDPAISLTGVTVAYGEVLALDGVDLTLGAGLVHGLVGMNGSGKSTLFKALMGRVRLTGGEVRLAGVTSDAARAAGLVSYMPQAENVDWDFPVSVREVVMMGRFGHQDRMRRIRAADRAAVADALAEVELTHLADRQIGRLSGGQKKRAFLARAMAQEAQILLLDEPFAGVDRPSEDTIIRLLRSLAAQGRTLVVSTHDLAGLPNLADDVVLLQQRVIAHGTPEDVLRPETLGLAFGAPAVSGAGR